MLGSIKRLTFFIKTIESFNLPTRLAALTPYNNPDMKTNVSKKKLYDKLDSTEYKYMGLAPAGISHAPL